MRSTKTRPRLFIQLLVGLAVLIGIAMLFGLSQNASKLRAVTEGETTMQAELYLEMTEVVHLESTRTYVTSDEYVEHYNRSEAGKQSADEVRVVIIPIEATPIPLPPPTATPDVSQYARPWQMWWSLLTDSPIPDS